MAANVETMFYTREKPWHGLGVRVEEAPASADALRLAGLDWEVLQEAIYTNKGDIISGYKANVRSTDRKVLGVVTDRYKVIQNVEAFEFTDTLLGSGVRYETAGSLAEGKKVWLLARLPREYIIGGERISPYLVFSNTHDGSGAVRVAVTPIRVVCNNTLNLALDTAKRSWSMVHTGDIKGKIQEAKDTLFMAEAYMDNLGKPLAFEQGVFQSNSKGKVGMSEKRKDNKGRTLKTGEYYDAKNKRYMFRKMVDGKRVTLTADDLPELRVEENKLLHMIDKGYKLKTMSNKTSLNSYFDYWLEMYAKSGRKATTCTNYKSYYNTYILNSEIGQKNIEKITKADFQKIINKMNEEGLSHSTMANLKSCLNNIFECAIDDELILKNPIKNIKLPQTNSKKRDAINQKQISIFMEYIKNNERFLYSYPAFVVLFNTGVRIGELIALTWDDVDLKSGTICVKASLNRYRKKDYGFTKGIASVKSKTSVRTIAMNSVVKTTLSRLKLQSPQETPVLPFVDDSGKVRGNVQGFIFLNNNGNVWTEPTFNNLIKRIIEAYNKEAQKQHKEMLNDFCPHQSRHTYTTAAYDAGVDMKAVSQMLGHASEQVTLSVYTHLSNERQKEQEEIARSINIS